MKKPNYGIYITLWIKLSNVAESEKLAGKVEKLVSKEIKSKTVIFNISRNL